LPITVQSSTVWKEIPISFFAIVIVFILSNSFFLQENNVLSRIDGALLFILFVLFLFYVYKQMKTEKTEFEIATLEISNWKIWGLITIGLAGLIFGGKLVVNNAIEIASNLGVSEKIIGLTIIAAGTSLPELVTSVVAALKKNSDIAIGNIIGSNIFNLLLILSVSSFIKPVTYNLAFNTDVYMLAGGTLFLFAAMFSGKKKKLDRWEAAVLLAVFLIYTTYLIAKEI
ncbi:MAG: sodium:calcium antiporter, partial [Bacteroidota bacterium]|nr:sodium:calcium antiporter [Bacteroidota bacterium]